MSDQRGQMVFIPAGTYRVGSESFYPEEAPIRSIQLQSFVIDVAPVTNAEFARFVADTGYWSIDNATLGIDAEVLITPMPMTGGITDPDDPRVARRDIAKSCGLGRVVRRRPLTPLFSSRLGFRF